MSKRDCLGPDGTCRCVASELMDVLGTKYAMDVLCVIANHDGVRFSTVEDHLPDASTSTLSARLDELAAADLIAREHYDEVPPRVEYRLTEEGRDLARRLEPLYEWLGDRETGIADGGDRGRGGHERDDPDRDERGRDDRGRDDRGPDRDVRRDDH